MASTCLGCTGFFEPNGNGADDDYCGYACAKERIETPLWACGVCTFDKNAFGVDICMACETEKPAEIERCPNCRAVFEKDSATAQGGYCSSACFARALDLYGGGIEDDVQTCLCCSAPFDVETWRAEYSGYCSYSCWAECQEEAEEDSVCPCCQVSISSSTHDATFAPYCSARCKAEGEEELVTAECPECGDRYVSTTEAVQQFNGAYCSWGCWCVSLRHLEDDETASATAAPPSTPALAVRMPSAGGGAKGESSFSPGDFDDGDYSGLAAIAPASMKAVPCALNRLLTFKERAQTKAQAEARCIIYHDSPIETYVQLECLLGNLPAGLLLDPFTNIVYQAGEGGFTRLGRFDPWATIDLIRRF